MRGDPEPMREMLDALVRDGPDHTRSAHAEGRAGSQIRQREQVTARGDSVAEQDDHQRGRAAA